MGTENNRVTFAYATLKLNRGKTLKAVHAAFEALHQDPLPEKNIDALVVALTTPPTFGRAPYQAIAEVTQAGGAVGINNLRIMGLLSAKEARYTPDTKPLSPNLTIAEKSAANRDFFHAKDIGAYTKDDFKQLVDPKAAAKIITIRTICALADNFPPKPQRKKLKKKEVQPSV